MKAQQAQRLAGHASLEAHARYLASSRALAALPEAAAPRIELRPAAKGSTGSETDQR